MTRGADSTLSLQGRAELCKKYKPDLFISIHCNAAAQKTISGIETFAMTPNGCASSNDSKPGNSTGTGNSFDKNNYRMAYEIQKALLKKLEVENSQSQDKEEKIDTKAILLVALRVFGAMPGQIIQAKEKIVENHEILESEHNTFWEKLKKALRKAFNIEEKPVFYQISISDQTTDAVRHEKVDYMKFIRELEARARKYASAGIRKAPLYEKISQQSEEKILEYVNQQILECNKMLKYLNGLDEFFKNAPLPQNRQKIKGLKMEITALKNSIVKANQHRSEYSAYVEEEAQLKKLGIKNA